MSRFERCGCHGGMHGCYVLDRVQYRVPWDWHPTLARYFADTESLFARLGYLSSECLSAREGKFALGHLRLPRGTNCFSLVLTESKYTILGRLFARVQLTLRKNTASSSTRKSNR